MKYNFYDYDYSGFIAKPLNYKDPSAPVETARKCDCCGNNLGSQNPGFTCSHCNYIKYQN